MTTPYRTVKEAHDRAMQLMDDAERARHGSEKSRRCALEALRAETEAVTLAFDRRTSVVTRCILLNSLANIADFLVDRTANP